MYNRPNTPTSMKPWILSILFALSTLASYAQAESKVTYIADEDKFVTTIPKSIAYELPGGPVFYSWRINYAGDVRYVVDYSSYKTKKLKKPQTLLVRGYANKNKQLEYDTYVVEINKKLCFLPCEYVEDNTLINSQNNALASELSELTTKSQNAKAEVDSLVVKHTKISETQLAYCQKAIDSLPAIIDSVKSKAREDYRALEKAETDKWYNSLPKSTQKAYSKLSITEAELSAPNSAAGCDYTFTYVNNSNKTIKYLYWEGTFYNAVNDRVYCEIRDYCTFRGQDTGPVEPGESGGGVWECVIYNWSADYVKLSSVSIIYMDGTTTTIGASDIARLITIPSSWDFYTQHGSEYDAEQKAAYPYVRELRDCEGDVHTWEQRLKYLQSGQFKYPRWHETEEYQAVFDRISKAYNEHLLYEEKLAKFRKNNLMQ